jgi:beta-fructofuranosidase
MRERRPATLDCCGPTAVGSHDRKGRFHDLKPISASSAPSVRAEAFRRIYDPSAGEDRPWYLNDHTFVYDPDGARWHLFGITHPEPADPMDERMFAHASAERLFATWTKHAPGLEADDGAGESFIWAPHVICHAGRFWMFYAAGTPDPTAFRMHLATSVDLFTWTRSGANPLFTDGYDGRDPCVVWISDRWVMYYCATSAPTGGNHVVAYRESADLLHWGERAIAFTDPIRGTTDGPTESPFVVSRPDGYYLFIGPRGGYVGTDVFFSTDPLSFRLEDIVGHIASHAAEVIEDVDGSWYVSRCGWGQGGVDLARLEWPG